MGCELKLRRADALNHIRDLMIMKSEESKQFAYVPKGLRILGKSLQSDGVKYKFDYRKPVANGLVSMLPDDSVISASIGVKNLKPKTNDTYVEDEDFAKVIWVLCHESAHVKQCNEKFSQIDADLSVKQQAIENVATRQNRIYYTDFHNYEKNSNELEAEWSGFVDMVEYLHTHMDWVDNAYKDEMIVNIVNQQCENDYFLGPKGRKFLSVAEIEDAFQMAYIESFDTPKKYPMPGTNVFDTIFGDVNQKGCKNKDVLAICAGGDEKLRTVFANADSRFEQDLIVAAVNKRVCPTQWSGYKCLDDIDLSYQHVIADKYDEIMAERSKTDTWYDRAYKEADKRNVGADEKTESESEPEVKDVEMHNNRRLPHIEWDNEEDKQDEFQ